MSDHFPFARWPVLVLAPVCGLLLALMTTAPAIAQAADSDSGYLHVLFLGDNGHHEPAGRARHIRPVLAKRGIHLTYTDRLDALTPSTLSQYDAVLIYANHPHLSANQARALHQYVHQGGGLVPVHSASACFGNSEAYIKLIGGAFKAHGTDTVTTRRVRPEHPAINGVPAITSWDETYVHHKHNPDKTVLSVRVEGEHEEPWTWVRTPGQGRVFYTAWGHDLRTWSTPAFQRLLEQGIRWAIGDDALQLEGRVSTLDYDTSAVPLPYYPPGEDWGTTGPPIRTIQKPLAPAASMQHMALPPGFTVRLFASEPDIVNPIDMAWDVQGRLWVAETIDYPNTVRPDGGRDRIRILEDTDGDGRADAFTTFADSLNIPTSLLPVDGGVIVAQAPHMLFLKDTDGDDRADVRETLISGWGTFDTHAGPSHLHYGFDNMIWGAVGYSGFSGTVGGEELEFGQGFYRFPRDGLRLEYLATTSNNTWGLGFNEEGHVFGSTANGNPAVHMAIPHRYYEAVTDWSAPTLGPIADSDRIHPIADTIRQVDHHGRYTAGAGFQVYTARAFPTAYWNRMAFVSAPTGQLLGQFAVEPDGASFRAHNAWSLLASRDDWTAPIAAEVGPDGMLWVIDWYNLVIQHNPTPDAFERGEGNAYETPLRDREHARIYRILPSGRDAAYDPMSLHDAAPEQLVAALQHDNMFWRMTAQRLLVERGEPDVLPALYALVRDESLDAVGNAPGALHALWTMHGLGALDGTNEEAMAVALDALHHPAPAVRRAALLALPPTPAVQDAILDAGMLPDPQQVPGAMDYVVDPATLQEAAPHVRLAALLALSETPPTERAGRAVAAAVTVPANVTDPLLRDGLTAAGAQHHAGFLQAALAHRVPERADSTYRANVTSVLSTVATHYAAQAPSASIVTRLERLSESTPFVAEAFLNGVVDGWPADAPPALEPADRTAFSALSEQLPDAHRSLLRDLAERWGLPALFE